MRARLVLEDGTEIIGTAFGATSEKWGEVIFQTSMTGYQEVISDPAYCGQIIVMTYPLIGNYGINRDDFEAFRPYIHGLVVKEICQQPSNWRSTTSLDDWLKAYDIPGIAGVDTRMLTRKIRQQQMVRGLITTSDAAVERLVAQLRQTPPLTDQVAQVSTKNVFSCPGTGERVVLIDLGSKHSILRELTKRGCDVVVVPYDVSAAEINRLQPDGVLLSNGPGNPKDLPQVVDVIRQLLGHYPMFGISLGHQLMALAQGADTVRLSAGHRAGNHPVKELASNRTYIVAQNHGYTVRPDSIDGTRLEVTHLGLNDGGIEGLRYPDQRSFSVQFQPEAAPGPTETKHLFDQFMAMIRLAKEEKADA